MQPADGAGPAGTTEGTPPPRSLLALGLVNLAVLLLRLAALLALLAPLLAAAWWLLG